MKQFKIKIPVTVEAVESVGALPYASFLEFEGTAPEGATPEECLRAFAYHLGMVTKMVITDGATLPRS